MIHVFCCCFFNQAFNCCPNYQCSVNYVTLIVVSHWVCFSFFSRQGRIRWNLNSKLLRFCIGLTKMLVYGYNIKTGNMGNWGLKLILMSPVIGLQSFSSSGFYNVSFVIGKYKSTVWYLTVAVHNIIITLYPPTQIIGHHEDDVGTGRGVGGTQAGSDNTQPHTGRDDKCCCCCCCCFWCRGEL